MMQVIVRNNIMLLSLWLLVGTIDAFTLYQPNQHCMSLMKSSSSLSMIKGRSSVNEEEEQFFKYTKASRTADANDNVVELMRPLGLVLKEDEYRNVYVETVAPRGNAARTGQISEGDYIVMCSATFGDDMWSTRGAGLSRVLQAIRVRSGSTVKLVVESRNQAKTKQAVTLKQIQAREEAKQLAQQKKDLLLQELENDEKILNPKKFFGLF
jgi:C-terminal processing protease CtpA/Prc